MGSPDLIRTAVAVVRRARIALLLVVATLVAELVDLVVVAHADGVPLAVPDSAELASCLAGVGVAGALGLWFGREPAMVGRVAAGWSRLRASRPGRGVVLELVAGAGRFARARGVRLTGALLAALVVHELTALGLHAEHGEGLWEIAAHVGGSVVPVALVVGGVLALLVGTRVVRSVVSARRPGRPLVVAVAPTVGRATPSRHAIVAGLLASLRIAGRAPPVALG